MMTIKSIRIIAATVALTLAASAGAKSPKRGVAENAFQMQGQMTPLTPGVTWYYNWATKAGQGYKGEVAAYDGIEYVPMCWNGVNAADIRAWCADHPECRYILGFNEPNFKDQANLTPAQAAEKWPELVALARELGLQIVAPALNYSPDAPYTDPSRWMSEFAALVGPDAFDYTAIHCYGGVGVMQTLATQFHDLYGKPVWVTEFCMWPGGAGSVYVSPEAQMASMIASVEWLERTEWIHRYAWFKPIGDHNSPNKPNYGLLVNATGYGTRELSPQGWVYVYMSDFDTSVWHPVGETVAASQYVASSGVLLAKGTNDSCPSPIEISQLNAGASADYQFTVPSAGEYCMELTVSGVGEPTRFDPSLAISEIAADGTATQLATTGLFALTGDDAAYKTIAVNIELGAGTHTLRVADVNPYQPSGIHVSTLKLTDAAGIGSVTADDCAPADVYSLQGIKVRSGSSLDGLPAGIYIVGSRKIRI